MQIAEFETAVDESFQPAKSDTSTQETEPDQRVPLAESWMEGAA